MKQASQDLGAFLEGSWLRQLADVAFDAHQSLRLDDRTNVVEHGTGDCRWPDGCQQHRQDAAARSADKDGRKRFQCSDDGQNIGELDRKRVLRRIAIVLRQATTAVVGRDHAARVRAITRKRGCQDVKISRRAGEAGQADDGSTRCAGSAVTARV